MSATIADVEREVISCRLCPRLVEFRERMGREKRRAFREETYWARPVPGFGDGAARVVTVGLAPGAHGSNRTGRMFTGDASGDFLFPALHRAGFADRPSSVSRGDGLVLRGLFITAVCRCAPPDNKPTSGEIANCLPYLAEEIRLLAGARVAVALGKTAYDALARMLTGREYSPGRRLEFESPMEPSAAAKAPAFAHGVRWEIRNPPYGGRLRWVLASYHPSRQNTQTGRLTRAMFDGLWRKARELAYEY
jgi:uracil-DNA glycosylase family 4